MVEVPPATPAGGRRAILVLGMHRSGTSALSGVACALGASPPCTLMPATAYNPRGYWESQPLVLVNDELLASAASAWDDWRELDPGWYGSSECEGLRGRFRDVLRSEYGDAPLFLVKDPRLCRILPFFLSVLQDIEVEPVALLSLRNPLEVALSLQRRNGFPISKSIALWLRHMLDAELCSRHLLRRIVSYEDLLGNWRLEMGRAADDTGVRWPVDFDAAAPSVGDFLAADLRRERSDPADHDKRPELAFLAAESYRLFRALSNIPGDTGLLAQIDAVRSKFNEASGFFGAIQGPEKVEAEKLRADFAHASGEFERQRTLLDRQALQLEQLQSRHDQLQSALDAKTADAEHLAGELDATMRRQTELQSALDAETADSERLAGELDATMRRQTDLQAELGERDGRVAGISLALEASRNDVQALRTSRSWRLTAPLRAISDLFQKATR